MSDINISSPHRSPKKEYANELSTENLEKFGESPETIELLQRGGNIEDPTMNSGGKVNYDKVTTLPELDRLDEKDNQKLLFPEEKKLLPKVHKLFEMPELTKLKLPPLKTVEFEVTKPTRTFSEVKKNIKDLPQDLQRTARRVQLVLNDDASAKTISLEDAYRTLCTGSVADGLTAAEIDQVEKIVKELGSNQGEVTVTLPLRNQYQTLVNSQNVKVELGTYTDYNRLGSFGESGGNNNPPYAVIPEFKERHLKISLPEGYKVFVKATSQVKTSVGFFEKVVEHNPDSAVRINDAEATQAGSSLWVQIKNPAGELVENVRVEIPSIKSEPFNVAPEARGCLITGWRDHDGDAVQPFNSDNLASHSVADLRFGYHPGTVRLVQESDYDSILKSLERERGISKIPLSEGERQGLKTIAEGNMTHVPTEIRKQAQRLLDTLA